ncbi:MAG: UDP-N-acetylmuramoyl-L-alanine--D-glutamate ligase [Candidatus Peregrinibacteria bacterium]|nr:UDP-N-acetylmuramoyl-L-alanine--D-glutamate ligase [Candidatus Peregrinibacteria bacterium]MCB9808333.1 UDP-N-acetylmuramoyl-L-alanine--D-glutamate ligase [Candidatus Peribacteria bacterium]
MNICDLSGKSVCILGYGREGKAMVDALEKHAPNCKIVIADKSNELPVTNYETQCGDQWLHHLDRFDVLIKSPGIPPSQLVTVNSQLLTNSTQIFLDSIDPRALVIGVTGSKGKSTTASLIHCILKEAGRKTVLLGNIGDAAVAHIDEIDEHTIVVLEMSSYQLMQLSRSPQIAVVTSFFPEHLNYHGTLEEYKNAKKHITKFQTPDDTVFYYAHNDGASDIASLSPGTKTPYDDADSPIAVHDTKLMGIHNLFNIAGASKVARHLGIEDATIIKAAAHFEGLPHRLQSLGVHQGIHWIDDAISTTPDSTIAAIKALEPNVHILIAGGQDRGSDFTQLGAAIDSSSIEHVIVQGETGQKIAAAINKKTIHAVQSVTEAVQLSVQLSAFRSPLSTCLLSPASPSYDLFTNFEEKGKVFKEAIFKLPQCP